MTEDKLNSFFNELKITCNHNPDLTILEVIDIAVNKVYATHKTKYSQYWKHYINEENNTYNWKLTDYDIINALQKYNKGINK